MVESSIHILLVEDDEAHAALLRRGFEPFDDRFRLTVAGSLAQARTHLSQHTPDLIIADLILPDGRGIELLPTDRDPPPYPLVVTTSHGNEQTAVAAMKAGVLDYVVKSAETLLDMPRVAERAMREWQLTVERRRAEEALRESEERYRDLVENITDVIYAVDSDGIMTYVNPAIEPFLGYSPSETIGHHFGEFIYQQDLPRLQQSFQRLLAGHPTTGEYRVVTKSGEVRWMHTSSRPVVRDGHVIGVQGVIVNITERKQAEQAVIQATRLEAAATLASGIAHRVNNLMVSVLGYAELLKSDLADNQEARDMLTIISQSAEQTGELALQLLAFSRGHHYRPRVLNLNDTVQQVLHIEEPSVPAGIHVELNTQPGLWPVEADPTQVNQVFLALLRNAVEAIEDSGRVTVSTANVLVDEDSSPGIAPGPYVYLSVQDTGCGMSAEVQAKVFEPFFTTKMLGRGLGLAAAHGIVRNHKGHIAVDSEKGHGATFTVYLPAIHAELEGPSTPQVR